MPWPFGPADGRYLMRARGSDPHSPPTHVLLFTTLEAQRRQRLTRRTRPAPPLPEPTPVLTGRATVLASAEPFVDAAVAARWLATAGEAELAVHLRILEQALHAQRVVDTRPSPEPLTRERLLVARLGFGEGEQVADGYWLEARELAPATDTGRRSRLLEPPARLAAVLAGRVPVLLCEELALDTRRELDAGRSRTAALLLRDALDAARAELAHDARLAAHLADALAHREAVGAAATAALLREPGAGEIERLGVALIGLDALLRARVALLG